MYQLNLLFLFRSCVVIFAFLSMPAILCAQTTSQYESPPSFSAADLLPKALLKGEDYQIHSLVVNDGLQNRYELTTSFGSLTVLGKDLLLTRMQEIRAIRGLENLKKTEVYGEALKNAAIGPVSFAKNLVLSPIDTVSNTASGVGKWFGNIGHSIWGGGSEHEEGTFKTILGFDSVKRKYAHEFNVDPYSSYPQLQVRLNEVSWTAFSGSLTVKVAFAAIPGAAGAAVGATNFSNGMRKLIADKTPAELKDYNEEKLEGMGVHESLIEVFLEHPQYSPTQKTFLVGALDQMDGVKKREVFIQAASLAGDETFAFYRRRQAEMMAAYHKQVLPVLTFHWIGGTPVLQNKQGALIIPVPADHVAWTRSLARMASQDLEASLKTAAPKGKELWISGTISPLARKNHEAKGWIVKENMASQLTLQ